MINSEASSPLFKRDQREMSHDDTSVLFCRMDPFCLQVILMLSTILLCIKHTVRPSINSWNPMRCLVAGWRLDLTLSRVRWRYTREVICNGAQLAFRDLPRVLAHIIWPPHHALPCGRFVFFLCRWWRMTCVCRWRIRSDQVCRGARSEYRDDLTFRSLRFTSLLIVSLSHLNRLKATRTTDS